MIYGYCRVSTKAQDFSRQERNILKSYPDAVIIKEVHTGTTFEGRKELLNLIKDINKNDTIVFDSVDRMSRDANKGVALYLKLYQCGINLVFLKQPFCDTYYYSQTPCYTIGKVKKELERYENEILILKERTKEGLETARLNGKQIGLVKGTKLTTKKSVKAKDIIKAHSKTFGGSLTDKECIALAKITKDTYYKYKSEIKAELQEKDNLLKELKRIEA